VSNDGATLYLSAKIKECNTATVSRKLLADTLGAGMTSSLSPNMPVPSGASNSNRRLQARAAQQPQTAVYTNNKAGMVVALKESDGTTEWSLDTGNAINGLMVLNGDGSTLYAGSKKKLWAINALDGIKLWESAEAATQICSQPLVSHDGTVIYVAYYNGEVSAFRATDATELWRTDASLGEIWAVSPSSLVMSSNGAKIFGATQTGNVFALESSNGSQDWVVDLSGKFTGGIALSSDDSTMYIIRLVNTDATVLALDTSNGSQRWQSADIGAQSGNGRGYTPVLSADGSVLYTPSKTNRCGHF